LALFKIHKGAEKNSDGTSRLPSSYVEGYAYFATDTGRFYIDTASSASGRKMINPDAVVNISRSGTTFTMTKADGSTAQFTQQDNNTNYYHNPLFTSGVEIGSGTGGLNADLYVPEATASPAAAFSSKSLIFSFSSSRGASKSKSIFSPPNYLSLYARRFSRNFFIFFLSTI
jgi:hypothetical protein